MRPPGPRTPRWRAAGAGPGAHLPDAVPDSGDAPWVGFAPCAERRGRIVCARAARFLAEEQARVFLGRGASRRPRPALMVAPGRSRGYIPRGLIPSVRGPSP
jgi:hypothetical protein